MNDSNNCDDQLVAQHAHHSFSSLALFIKNEISFDQWGELGLTLRKADRATKFWIGDWLNFGKTKWERQRYEEGLRILGLPYGTLANLAYVAGQVESSRRRESVSFSHHQEVASLPPDMQVVYLDRAEEDGLTTKGLRELIKKNEKCSLENQAEPLPKAVVKDKAKGKALPLEVYVADCVKETKRLFEKLIQLVEFSGIVLPVEFNEVLSKSGLIYECIKVIRVISFLGLEGDKFSYREILEEEIRQVQANQDIDSLFKEIKDKGPEASEIPQVQP